VVVGVAIETKSRTNDEASRPTVAALVVVVLLIGQMLVSLLFPAAMPRLIILPQPPDEVVVDSCGHVKAPFGYDRESIFWVRHPQFVDLVGCL
jgi:hypothetical protein